MLDNGPIAIINYLNDSWNENFKLDIDKAMTEE